MRSTILVLSLAFAALAKAQQANPTPNLVEAGVHLEKDGKLRTAAMTVSLLGALVLVAGTATADGEEDQTQMAAMAGGAIGVVGITMNFIAAGHAKKAGGGIMQGKPL